MILEVIAYAYPHPVRRECIVYVSHFSNWRSSPKLSGIKNQMLGY